MSFLLFKFKLEWRDILIYLKERENSKSQFIFPSMPEEIRTSVDTNYQTYSFLNRGSISVPKGIDAKKISWDGEFFGWKKKNESLVLKNNWVSPKECKKILEDWQRKGTILTLIITEAGIILDVTISSFEKTSYGAYGNLKYHISFEKADVVKVYTNLDKKKNGTEKKQYKERTNRKIVKSYTIKKGDTLCKISKGVYGSVKYWKKIYEANKQIIEKVAKKYKKKNSDYGHWIYPGTILNIPKL